MRLKFTVSTTKREARRGEESLARGHIHIRPSQPLHVRPRSLEIFVSKPIAKVCLSLPVSEVTRNLLPNLINTDLPAQQRTSFEFTLQTAVDILTVAHGFPWVLKVKRHESTPAGEGTMFMDVCCDGYNVRCGWAAKPENALCYINGSWLQFLVTYGKAADLGRQCLIFGVLPLPVLVAMWCWAREFTWMQGKVVLLVWVVTVVLIDWNTLSCAHKHPKMKLEITLKEQEGPLIGGGGLTIEHGARGLNV